MSEPSDKIVSELRRPICDDGQGFLFDVEPDWRDHWWGMPEFSMADVSPTYRITINFLTAKDVVDFAAKAGLKVTTNSDSAWFPHQDRLAAGRFFYDGKKTACRYPICIPSKGRFSNQITGHLLEKLGVEHRFFVEETEYEQYASRLGAHRVVKMPFHDLGLGSIPARNFIWEWAKERGHARHWVIDDNIKGFARLNNNRRLRVKGGGFFSSMEDFCDRYENIGAAGPHNIGFVGDRTPNIAPFLLNSRIYSCILLDTNLNYRWRGRYNEDTDLSLRMLKDGLCTVLFRALLMDKAPTSIGDGGKTNGMAGGNTDTVYTPGNYRLDFAKSLEEQHPDCVKVTWKFNRWHHEVDYSAFKANRLILRPSVTKNKTTNNYGMELKDGE